MDTQGRNKTGGRKWKFISALLVLMVAVLTQLASAHANPNTPPILLNEVDKPQSLPSGQVVGADLLPPQLEQNGPMNMAAGTEARAGGPAGQQSLLDSPAPASSFQAQTDNGNSPPGTHGAVGPNHLMSVHNGTFRIQDHAGNQVSIMTDVEFWEGLPDPVPTGLFAPKILYDPYNGRWLVTELSNARSADSSILIAISQTNNPNGTWERHRIDVDDSDTYWADDPGFGFNKNWVAITVNDRRNDNDAFVGGRVFTIDYPTLLDGDPLVCTVLGGNHCTILGGNYSSSFTLSMQPAVTYSPTEERLFLVKNYDLTGARFYFVFAITSGSSGPSFNLIHSENFPSYVSRWVSSGGDILPQPNPPVGPLRRIASIDARISSVVFRNSKIWYAQTVGLPYPDASHTAVQWVQLDIFGNYVQSGRIEDTMAKWDNGKPWYAYPSITVNQCDDVLIGYSIFRSDEFASAGYSFSPAAALPPNTMQPPYILKAGEGYYEKAFGQVNHWGPYSATVVDPDNNDMWTIQEYAQAPVGTGDGSGRWGTWWGRVPIIPCAPVATSTTIPTPAPTNTATNTPTTREPTKTPTQIPTATSSPMPSCGALDVVFIIDDTFSMQGAIKSITNTLSSILTTIDQTSGGNYRLAMVTFNHNTDPVDHDDITVHATLTPGNRVLIQTQMNALTAHGGGLIPEASDEALHTVISALPASARLAGEQHGNFSPGYRPGFGVTRIAVLVTDAVPGGFDDINTGADDARARGFADLAAHLTDPENAIRIVSIFVPTGSLQAEEIMANYASVTHGRYVRTLANGDGAGAGLLAAMTDCGRAETATPQVTGTVTGTPTSPQATATVTATVTATPTLPRTAMPTQTPTCGAMDVVFIIDDTGSMGGAINSIKLELSDILDEIDQASGGDYQLGLVTFNHNYTPVSHDDVTVHETLAPGNRISVEAKLNSLSAGGGNGVAESSDEALHTVISALKEGDRLPGEQDGDFSPAYRTGPGVRRIAVLVTDAVPGGFDDIYIAGVDDVRAHGFADMAASQDIRIVSIFVPTGSLQAEPIMQYYASATHSQYVRTAANGNGAGAGLLAAIADCGQAETPTPQATIAATTTPTATATCAPPTPVKQSGSITSDDPVMTKRLEPSAMPSTCDTVPNPDLGPGGGYYYETHTFFNPGPTDCCVTITLYPHNCTTTPNLLHSTAYLNSFDPTDPFMNYLGDIGPPPTGPASYQVRVPANQTLVVVVYGFAPSGTCSLYIVAVDNLGCCPPPVPTATNTPTTTNTPTSTATNTATATATCVPPTPVKQSGSITSDDPVMTKRLEPSTVSSTCDTVPNPDLGPGGGYYYETHTFFNPGPTDCCVTITLYPHNCTTAPNLLHSTAYLNSFDPTDPFMNYLGDIGQPPTGPASYQVRVPANQTLVVVVYGFAPSGTCSLYIVAVDNLGCCPPPMSKPTNTSTSTPGGKSTPMAGTATRTVGPTSIVGTPTTAKVASSITPRSTATTGLGRATPVPPSACLKQFSDVPEGSTFYPDVRYLVCRGIISGYSDGTFRPNNPTNATRGQAAKFIANSVGLADEIPPTQQTFEDVDPTTNVFWVYIERMAQHGYIVGYQCGGPGEDCMPGNRPYFRWGNNITRNQLSKILVLSNQYDLTSPSDPHFQDVAQSDTFYSYVETAYEKGLISGYPCGGPSEPCATGNKPYLRGGANATRGQLSKMVTQTLTGP
jgi:hypothetical protein